MKRIPRERGKRYWKRKNFSKRIKRSLGSTRAAAGVCVRKIVGGGCEKNPQRKREEVLEEKKH